MRSLPCSIFAGLILLGICSCGDDTEVGYGLLGEEELELVFVDDLDIEIRQTAPTPIVAQRSIFHSLGTLDDPIFGKLQASFYVRPNVAFTPPDFAGSTYDSLILSFQIDTSRFFGNKNASHDIEVFTLLESIDNLENATSDETYSIDPNPVGTIRQFISTDSDSSMFISQFGDTLFFKDVLQIRLDDVLGKTIFEDTLNNNSQTGFETLLNGFYIKSTSENSLQQVDLSSSASGLIFYYHNDSIETANYLYPFNSAFNPLHLEYDLTGSVLEDAIDTVNNDVLYLQGHAGSTLEIDISALDQLQNPFVNYASLEFFAQTDGPIDTVRFPLPRAFDLMKEDPIEGFTEITDLQFGIAALVVDNIFDGSQQNVGGIIKYEMKITNFVKAYLKGAETSKIYLTVRNRVETPNNIILLGPNHPSLRARLNLTYTKS